MSRSCGRGALRAPLLVGAWLAVVLPLPGWCLAQAEAPQQLASAGDLTQLSLNELLNIEVTSVSKRPQPLADSAAAVFVLSGEDIRSSGVHSIAEALRMVPGLDVAQASGTSYAISARGFNSTTEDKLQVLLDGRSVYTPLFSGVNWDTLDTYLDDIDRIEVIRGPGAALWGANAVNGVINIITRSARDTLGSSAQASGGNYEHVYGAARSGFAAGEGGAVRIYAQGYSRGDSPLASGASALDSAAKEQLGFRSDWSLAHGQALTVSGDGYTGREGDNSIGLGPPGTTTVSGGNVLARWSGGAGPGADWSLQAYFDNFARQIPSIYSETRNTADVEFQQSLALLQRHAVTYGLGYRNTHDDTAGPPILFLFDPPRRTLQSASAFVQDQIALGAATQLTVGTKLEQNTYGGFNVQPSIRLGWHPAEQLFTWAAVSRAVRTPNRVDEDIALYCPPPLGIPGVCAPGVFPLGNPHLKSEQLIAYEWGARVWGSRNYSFDLAAFYNDYSDLRSAEPTALVETLANKVKAHSEGGELSARWQPLQQLDLRAFYDLLVLSARTVDGSVDKSTVPGLLGSDPRHQLGLQLTARPAPRWQAAADLRYVDKLRAWQLPDYAELGGRVAYSPLSGLSVALIGRNLLASGHAEFESAALRAELRRSAMLELRWDLR